jgi:hypothetical protein
LLIPRYGTFNSMLPEDLYFLQNNYAYKISPKITHFLWSLIHKQLKLNIVKFIVPWNSYCLPSSVNLGTWRQYDLITSHCTAFILHFALSTMNLPCRRKHYLSSTKARIIFWLTTRLRYTLVDSTQHVYIDADILEISRGMGSPQRM